MKRLKILLSLLLLVMSLTTLHAQHPKSKKAVKKESSSKKNIEKIGIASYYAHKFHGRKTASGEIYRNEKLTAACNVMPLHSWVKVTNLKNNRSVILKINDRLHGKNKRLLDVSKFAAEKLGFIKNGTAKVKVEVVDRPTTKTVISKKR